MKKNDLPSGNQSTVSAHAGQLGDTYNIQIKYELSNFTQDSSHDP